MVKDKKALEKLLPGRKGTRLAGFVLLFLAIQLAVMAWFSNTFLAPLPSLLDEQSRDGDYVYLTVAESADIFAEDSEEMGYYFMLDRDGLLAVVRMDKAQYVMTLEKLTAGHTVALRGQARTATPGLRDLVIRSWSFLDESNYYDYFTVCYLDCTITPTFLPALLCLVAALMFLLLSMTCFLVWLVNRQARQLCLDRLEDLGLADDALAQLSAPEGHLTFAPDILVTRDFLAVGTTSRICALEDVQATRAGRKLKLVLKNGRTMPVQHGLFPKLDTRLLEHLCRLVRKE